MATVRSTWWSITINNPTDDDRSALAAPPTFVKRIKYQDEVGENGTLHIQGAVNTAQCRMSMLKQWLPRAHLEPARDKHALMAYVEKTETAVEGTQHDVKVPFMSCAAALKRLAKVILEELKLTPVIVMMKDKKEHYFWDAVNWIIRNEDMELISLYSQPQIFRAWVNTYMTWLELAALDNVEINVDNIVQQDA